MIAPCQKRSRDWHLRRISFTPSDELGGYDFSAPTRFDKTFSGIVVPRLAFIPFADGGAHLGPEDPVDADYGRLLEAAINRKRGSSPTGTDPILRRNYVLEIAAA